MAAAAATAIAGGSNIMSSGLTAGMQILGQALNNKAQFQYNDSVINRAEKSFTDAGLPKYMAYSGGGSTLPTQQFQLRGSNFYSAGPVNSNLPVFSTQVQQMSHTASPRKVTNIADTPTSNSTWYVDLNDNVNAVRGQQDRQGLGYGRFVSAGAEFAPPKFNNAGSQAGFPTRDFSTQSVQNWGMTSRFTQTNTAPKIMYPRPTPTGFRAIN